MNGTKDPELLLALRASMRRVLMVGAEPSGDLVNGLDNFPSWGRLAAII